MNKQTSKYFNTAIRMDEALLSLLEKKDFQYITVKEICDKAEVNRSTFYLHYETVGDLLSETLEYITKRFQDKFQFDNVISAQQIASSPTEQLILITPQYLIPYLEFVKENRHVFKIALAQPNVIQASNTFKHFCEEIFYPIMRRFGMNEREMEYRLAFYIQGMIGAIREWVKNDCKEDVDTMAQLLHRCVFPKGELPL